MQLSEAAALVATTYGWDVLEFTRYVMEDPHTGWDNNQGDWPIGSLWRVEGAILYGLVRLLKPQRVLELGTGHGCSTTHLAEALKANGGGKVYAVDNSGDATAPGRIGNGIPDELRPYIQIEDAWIEDYLTQEEQMSFDLIFEDGIHSENQVQAVWADSYHILAPGGMIVSHDALHHIVGNDVRAGIAKGMVYVGEDADEVLYLGINPSDCGLAIWQKPGGQTEPDRFPDIPATTGLVGVDPFEDVGRDYGSWTIAELREELAARDIKIKSRKRSILIQALQKADGNG